MTSCGGPSSEHHPFITYTVKTQLISWMEEDVCFSDIQPQDLSPRRALRSLPPDCLSPWLDTGQNCSQRPGQGAPWRVPTLPPALAS